MITLETKLDKLPRISASHAKKLEKLNLFTVRDLFYHFPSRYEDFSQIYNVSELEPDTNATIVGYPTDVNTLRIPNRRLTITTAIIEDDSGSINAVWFNQKFVEQSLRSGDKLRISGKLVINDKNGLHFSSPSIERFERTPTSTGRLVPIYPETAGITSKWLRWQIQLLREKDIYIPEIIPKNILKKLNLPSRKKAIELIHFPKTDKEWIYATKYFMFEEMFTLQLITLRTRASLAKQKAHKIKFDEKLIKNFISSLPFKPTNAQRKSSYQILRDMSSDTPMNRLLNGDVGAGKTLVSAIAGLQVLSAGYQVAILAPTEVLAKQHFDTFLNMFEKYNFSIGLLTGAHKMYGSHPALVQSAKRKTLLNKISSGEINLVIGTHAIIQEDVSFKKLALIIVDEQHRFGVAQRAKLIKKAMESDDGNKSTVPHFLTMTATPIPRTFALALFGDLDVSLLDEKPAQRKEIKTTLVHPNNADKIYEFIKEELDRGRQAYIILPLVEETEALKDVKAVKQEYEKLSTGVFANYALGLMHGKLKSKEKEKLMKDFSQNKVQILVSTSVVEVGVDVPNATVMIIENAERFGLSQLHQFRGRIGRSDKQSYCFLFSTHFNSPRLKAMEKYSDGFKLAQMDLKLRGPGEFLGSQQSGLPDGAMKNLSNIRLVTLAREHAKEVLQKDISLKKQKELKQELDRFYSQVHME